MAHDTLSALMHDTGEASFSVGADGEVLCFALALPPVRRQSVTSPAAGSFLPRNADDGLAPLTAPADVAGGEVLGYLCRGAVRLPVSAPSPGRITGIRRESGGSVGAGEDLFTMEVAT